MVSSVFRLTAHPLTFSAGCRNSSLRRFSQGALRGKPSRKNKRLGRFKPVSSSLAYLFQLLAQVLPVGVFLGKFAYSSTAVRTAPQLYDSLAIFLLRPGYHAIRVFARLLIVRDLTRDCSGVIV